jgi:cyclo(L-tyrosyl-L-tyrosyl) synthase
MINVTPLTESCYDISRKKEHACIGISPFNSLFTEDYISSLIKWSLENFENFHLFIPDEPTFYTLEALGYDANDCRRKMKKQLNWLKNKIDKALEANDVRSKESHVLNWETLSSNPIFKRELDKSFGLFDSNEQFRKECILSSRWVLQNKIEEKDITDTKLLKAVKYFLSEIPLFAATNDIVGTKTSLFCYHQSIAFHEKLYRNELCLKPSPGQGYGKIVQGN